MIPLSEPSLKGNELKYVQECLETNWVSSAGKFVDLFESNIAAYTGASHAVAMVNGTAALHMALLVTDIRKDDEVLVPTLTFIAPVNVIRYCDAHPVFMDCDESLNIDPKKVKKFLEKECELRGSTTYNKKTGRRIHSILPVHIFGNPADMDALMKLAATYHLKVIEDATESLGSFYKGKHTGTLGHVGCFSFNGNKIITTGGGGMFVTNDKKLAAEARYLSTQAKDDELHYVHDRIGYNYRLTNIQAALGQAQLEKLPEILKTKKSNFEKFRAAISTIEGLSLVEAPSDTSPNYWFYTLVIAPLYGVSRDDLLKKLLGKGIQARPIWKLNHLQKPYQSTQNYLIEKAVTFQAAALNIPCSVSLTEDDIRSVVDVLKNKGGM